MVASKSSLNGAMEPVRSVGRVFFPLDEELGLTSSDLTPHATSGIGAFSHLDAFWTSRPTAGGSAGCAGEQGQCPALHAASWRGSLAGVGRADRRDPAKPAPSADRSGEAGDERGWGHGSISKGDLGRSQNAGDRGSRGHASRGSASPEPLVLFAAGGCDRV